ncbi:MAG TPA: hypothetical protein VHR66_08880 [Gemmataceae bacterium]|jgi:hypothetical protein|nr:hypothetical protein [Gemmataceae bacterium]
MFLIWRGRGLLAVVALFPMLISIISFIGLDSLGPCMIATEVSLILGGAVCVTCGMKWNRPRFVHDFWFIPLQIWGWIYLAVVAITAGFSVFGAIGQGLDRPRMVLQAAGGVITLLAASGAGALAVRLAGDGSGITDLNEESIRPLTTTIVPPPTDYSQMPRFGE